jgi:aminoglycoside phosphotransferase (APT) family kinase protein
VGAPTDDLDRTRVPYGYELPPEEHRLLRGRPPQPALDWAAGAIGRSARVVGVRARRGGQSSAVHALTIEGGDGRRHRVVLRRYVRPELQAEEPDLAEREAVALGVLEASTVPAPRLIAVDPIGDDAGTPAVLMTLLPGRIDWDPRDVEMFLERLAEPLPVIHAVAVPAGVTIRPYRPYELGRDLGPPPWTRYPRAWAKAIELYEGPPPVVERTFLHRDYHPGNVLWRGGRVTGVVDWQSASLGSPEADVAHCRSNLVDQFSIATADRFLTCWQAVSGRRDYHPYWDVTVVVAPSDSYGDPDPRLDEWVAGVVSAVG